MSSCPTCPPADWEHWSCCRADRLVDSGAGCRRCPLGVQTRPCRRFAFTSASPLGADVIRFAYFFRKVTKAAASSRQTLAPRRPSAKAVEALLDRCEAPVDHGFVLGVG